MEYAQRAYIGARKFLQFEKILILFMVNMLCTSESVV